MNIAEAKKVITERLEELHLGHEKVNYKLRDWLFSRQRYWGEPIPIIKLEDGTLVPEENLPLVLPELDDYKPQKESPHHYQRVKNLSMLHIMEKR